ncbi:MAG: ABC transporter permease [Clostridia bacterium]|nr:ABC transporter permease [Clostridia bacterium]
MANNKQNLLYEKLKERDKEEELKNRHDSGEDKPLALDDAQRVRVLSPSRLVVKRFLKNKLAITGLVILIFMFVMCFIGPIFYPYSQTDKFNKIDALNLDYAVCGELSSYTKYVTSADADDPVVNDLKLRIDSEIIAMEAAGETKRSSVKDGYEIVVEKVTDRVYKAYVAGKESEIAVCNPSLGILVSGNISEALLGAVKAASAANQKTFEFEGNSYRLVNKNKFEVSVIAVVKDENTGDSLIATKLVFDSVDHTKEIENDFKVEALSGIAEMRSFTYGGKTYSFDEEEGGNLLIRDDAGNAVAYISKYSVRHSSGADSLDLGFKMEAAATVNKMQEDGVREGGFRYDVPQLNPETSEYDRDENGNLILVKEDLNVLQKEVAGEKRYYISYMMNKQLISIYEAPSASHILGTDGDGYDVFARILYGGRVSLLVGFVVVILETILGVIMGGIAGFFGGWVDTLIMRLVDIFYCIPTMPIMIIIASVFDYYKLHPYMRLLWMMVILGILGWSGIARLVRGQILSLREQEFMIAAEATGLRTSKRIFKHLIPNVMPQLIVSMTMGLGGVILTESALSFLGLGVKHPLATWGNIINSVSTIEAMKEYTYIWIPVGILICLTVIAFNFVGDGLRDAFDPKMKR